MKAESLDTGTLAKWVSSSGESMGKEEILRSRITIRVSCCPINSKATLLRMR
jgi:hypothetical protein